MVKSIVELYNGDTWNLIPIVVMLCVYAYCYSKLRGCYIAFKYEKTQRMIQREKRVRQSVHYTGLVAVCFGIMDCVLGVILLTTIIVDIGYYPNWSGFLVVVALVSVFIDSFLTNGIDDKASQPEYAHMRQVVDKQKNKAEKVKGK